MVAADRPTLRPKVTEGNACASVSRDASVVDRAGVGAAVREGVTRRLHRGEADHLRLSGLVGQPGACRSDASGSG